MDTAAAKRSFSSLSISAETLASLEAKGYEAPTPVQEETIPLALAGKDLVVQSRTGTGKTAAFGIPIVEKVEATRGGVQAVVLAPTRELAIQVAQEISGARPRAAASRSSRSTAATRWSARSRASAPAPT